MEPNKFEKPFESRGESQTALPRPSERKPRFQIVKLEERIAPGNQSSGPTKGHNCGSHFRSC
jgi:hypothetical protein